MGTLLIVTFFLGYLFIVIEHQVRLDKAATALITGVLCWTVYTFTVTEPHTVSHQLAEQMGEIAGILFFLLGAMTIVELIDLHNGFEVITEKIKTRSKRSLFIIIGIISFFLSAVLDNLTTAIVMASMAGKIIPERNDRLYFAGLIVIAANAGGAWSPLGDVTTTMLWIGNQVSAGGIIRQLILPSCVSFAVPLLLLLPRLKGLLPPLVTASDTRIARRDRNIIFYTGIGLLLFVPVFKTLTHLPPFMGMMLCVGLLWAVSEFLHHKKEPEEKKSYSVFRALERIDVPSILFFLGILLAVGALQSYGTLSTLAHTLDKSIGNETIIVTLIGLSSAVFDNVPLVAAVQGMYSLQQYPTDHFFWEYLAYCAGTGGSMLIIGSAAGVAIMGIEKINFFWYLRRIGWVALLGYAAGALVFIAMKAM
jgi:Na+/H+ antiporter NhaD/arsenite permease-like protein